MSFKHAGAVAEAVAWSAALEELYNNGKISRELGYELAGLSGTYAAALIRGEDVNGFRLEDFESDGEVFETAFAQANAAKQGYPNA